MLNIETRFQKKIRTAVSNYGGELRNPTKIKQGPYRSVLQVSNYGPPTPLCFNTPSSIALRPVREKATQS